MRRLRVPHNAYRPALTNPARDFGRRLDWAALREALYADNGTGTGTSDEPPRALVGEFGLGDGEWLCTTAARHPDTIFVGVEATAHYFEICCQRAAEMNLANVFVALGDARMAMLPEFLPPATAREMHFLFPDPWPKKRHHRRRMLAAPNVPFIAAALADGGFVRLRSDVPDYIEMALENLPAVGFELIAHETNIDPARAVTRWERKALAEGILIADVRFRKPPGLVVPLPAEAPLDLRSVRDHDPEMLRRAGFRL